MLTIAHVVTTDRVRIYLLNYTCIVKYANCTSLTIIIILVLFKAQCLIVRKGKVTIGNNRMGAYTEQ